MEVLKYEKYTDMALNNIKLSKYLMQFYEDELSEKYHFVRGILTSKGILSDYCLRLARKVRHNIRMSKPLREELPIVMPENAKRWSGCYFYEDLTSEVRLRIAWIRDFREFLADKELKIKYKLIHEYIKYCLYRTEREIEMLLKMRRTLKKSSNNYVTADELSHSVELRKQFNFYNKFIKLNKKVA